MSESNHAKELKEITAYLEDEEIKTGYATFWNANILTELSDGYIDVYCWSDREKIENLENINQLYEWLQLVSHVEEVPSGKLFILLSKDEYEFFPWKDRLDEKGTDYQTDSYLMYLFDDYEELNNCME